MVTMYKKRTMGGRKRGPKRGRGIGSFFKKVWSGIKTVGKPISDLAKSTKLVSNVIAPAITARNPALGSIIGSVANSQGYGGRRRVRRRKVGGSLFSKLRTAIAKVKPYASRLNTHMKQSKWLSNELRSKNYPTAAKLVSALGYGTRRTRKKRVGGRRKKVVRGRGAGGVSGSLGNSFKANKSIIKF